MNLVLVRDDDDHKTTLGSLYIKAKKFCFTLEDTFRHEKIPKITRIPAGFYKIELRKEGGMYKKYQTRFGTNGMLWLKNVPDFEYVYIHVGNTDEDTDGCILVGGSRDEMLGQDGNKMRVLSSTDTYINLWGEINAEFEAGQSVYISIIDN